MDTVPSTGHPEHRDDSGNAGGREVILGGRPRQPRQLVRVSGTGWGLRGGLVADAQALTTLYLRSRAAAMPWLSSPHDEPATRWWMEHVVLDTQRVWVAFSGEELLGFASISEDWLEQLYVEPCSQYSGVGRALLDAVKDSSQGRLKLHVFTRNTRARLFYEAAGFIMTEQSDGSRNEELEPDCTYAWPG